MGKKAKPRKAKKDAPTVDGVKPAAETGRSPEVPIPSPEAGPQTVEEHLLHPGNLKGFRHLRAGGTIKASGTEAVRSQWPPEVGQRIISWLRAGEMTQLATFLRENPAVMAHPVVFHQVFHLHRLRYHPEEERDVTELSRSGPEYVLSPAGTRQAAREALQKLTTAWVQGVLGGAWTLKPPPKRRGRKASPDDISFNLWLLDQYEEVLNRLKREHVRRLKGESDPQWLARLCDVIRETWTDTSFSWTEVPAPPVDPTDRPKILTTRKSLTFQLEDLGPILTRQKRLPLPPEDRIKKWAEEAIEWAAEGPIRDRIAYHLLAYRWDMKANQVRWTVHAARRY